MSINNNNNNYYYYYYYYYAATTTTTSPLLSWQTPIENLLFTINGSEIKKKKRSILTNCRL